MGLPKIEVFLENQHPNNKKIKPKISNCSLATVWPKPGSQNPMINRYIYWRTRAEHYCLDWASRLPRKPKGDPACHSARFSIPQWAHSMAYFWSLFLERDIGRHWWLTLIPAQRPVNLWVEANLIHKWVLVCWPELWHRETHLEKWKGCHSPAFTIVGSGSNALLVRAHSSNFLYCLRASSDWSQALNLDFSVYTLTGLISFVLLPSCDLSNPYQTCQTRTTKDLAFRLLPA